MAYAKALRLTALAAVAAGAATSALCYGAASAAAQTHVITLHSCATGDTGTGAWLEGSSGAGMSTGNGCPIGRLRLLATGGTSVGNYAQWSTTLPSQMALVAATIPASGVLINKDATADGYGARYFWNGGQQPIGAGSYCCGDSDYASAGLGTFFPPSTEWFIIQVSCNQPTCNGVPGGQALDVGDITLDAIDNTAPSIVPDESSKNLADMGGHWVRGQWNASFTADSQAGVCQAYAAVDGTTVGGQQSPQAPNTGAWTQCGEDAGTIAAPHSHAGADSVTASADTTRYPDGALTLSYYAADPAQPANVSNPSYTVNVDNKPVTLDLSGPSDAFSTAGTQYVTATAAAGPSGVAEIDCSVDGSPYVTHAAATVQIPVQGIGSHHISCYARNNAVNAAGEAATSPTESWSLNIRQPSVGTASFTRLIDALHCHRVRERVRIPARWVTTHVHGQRIRIKLPAETRTVRITRCRPRFVRRRVRVGGHWYTETVVALPRAVRATTVRVRFGASMKINGWLGTAHGDALAGQPVRIMTAPDTPGAQFTQAAIVVTRADGTWTARLKGTSSRLVEASYDGSSTIEPSTSAVVRTIVPASVKLAISPPTTHWQGTIVISGRLRGCCVPPTVGELVVLHVGWSSGSAEIGHVYARKGGRFRATYTFLRGAGIATYRLWATTAIESDYPYAAGSSRKIAVTVGPP
jgi:hypothetical protein